MSERDRRCDRTSSKRVLVTGGSGGIGRAICLAFGEAGWQVGVHYRHRKAEAEATVAAVMACGGGAKAYQADLRCAAEVHAMVDRFVDEAEELDVLICNAGTSADHLLVRFPLQEWMDVIQTNLTGVFHCLQATAPQMMRRGGGAMVLVSSYAAVQGQAGQAAYAASKAGLLGLLRSAAREWGPCGIRVNGVFPGRHRTSLTETLMAHPETDDHLLGETADVTETARLIVALATAERVSGQIWNLDSRVY